MNTMLTWTDSFFLYVLDLLDRVLEVRTWLESRNLVLRNHNSGVLGDVATCLCLSCLHLECAESTEIYVLTLGH